MHQLTTKIVFRILIKTIFRFILLFIVCMTSDFASASSPMFYNLPLEQASPIYAIDQDADGLIWMGTSNGLYSFDGYRFVPHHEAYGTDLIFTVCTFDNYVVMGGRNSVVVYDRKLGHVVTMNKPIKDETRVIVRQGDQLLIGGKKALYRLSPRKKEVSVITRVPHDILSVSTTDRGMLIGTMFGLYEFTEGHCQRLNIFASQQQSAVSAIEYDRQTGRYWLGTFQSLFSYDIHTRKLQMLPGSKGMIVKSMSTTPQGLFVTSDDGLYIVRNNGIEHLVHDSQKNSSLGNNIVWDVFSDSSGNILLGTERCLSIIIQNGSGYYNSLSSLTGSTIGNDITCILRDSHGTMWLGGTVGLVHMSSPVCWFLQNNSAYTISHNRVRDICEDRMHNIWISTDIGINLYDYQRNKMEYRMIVDGRTRKEIPWVYDMLDDGMGHLWLGTCEEGVYVTSHSSLLNTSHFCIPERHIIDGLTSKDICQLAMGRGGKIWALTTKGINVVDARTYRVSTLRQGSADLIYADKDGNIWIADAKGIQVYSSPDKKIYDITFNSQIENNRVISMMEIYGNMWVVTQTCCAVYHKGQWLTNVRIPFLTPHSACYDAVRRQIIIGGVDGTVTLSPQQILRQSRKQTIVLSDILVNGKQYRPDDGDLMTKKGICLSSDQNNLEFMLSDLPLLNSGMAIYAYRLKGLEKEWHYMQKASDKIVYNSIPYGDYTLEVHLVDGFDKIGSQLYSLDIDILPPWYLSWWAKAVYLLLAIGIVYGGIKLYITRRTLLKEQQARLQIMDESEARIHFYNSLSQKLHNGLSHIMSSITSMAEKDSERKYRPDFIRLGYESTCLNAFIRQALDTGKSSPREEGQEETHDLNVVGFCDAVVNGMAEDVRKRNIRLSYQALMSELFYKVNIIEWDSVVYTLLKSIIDYSANGASIAFNVYRAEEKGYFAISVSSTLFSVMEEKMPFFFQRYYDLIENDSTERTHNMYLVKEYVDKHMGSVDIQKNENGLVVATLQLPLDREIEEGSADSNTPILSLRDDKLLKDITSIIEANISNSDFNVTELQKEAGIGSKLLYRKVKLCTGMSPVEYIRDIRMKRAALLLSEGRFAISEVMYMVGFSNSGYFSKCFQKAFGSTPTNFMRCH